MQLTDHAVDALAAFRLTRLATADSITQDAREAVLSWAMRNNDDPPSFHDATWPPDLDADRPMQHWVEAHREHHEPIPKLADLVTCRWCASVWVSLGVVAARRLAPRLWGPLARALAMSALAALLARLED